MRSRFAPETQSNHFQSCKIKFRDKKPPQSKISEAETARKHSFLRSRRDFVGKNRPKNGLRGRDNDYKHSFSARKVSEPNIESSFNSKRRKMGSRDPFFDFGFFKDIQDFGLKYFVSQSPTYFCPITTSFDRFWQWMIILLDYKWFWLQNLILGVKSFRNSPLLNALDNRFR